MSFALFHFQMDTARALVVFPASLLGLYFAVFRFRQFLWLMVALIPLSVSFKDLGGGVGASFPLEPMLGLAAILAGVLLLRGKLLIRSVMEHPITWLIGLQVVWAMATALVSAETVVSFKFVIARLTYLLVFYFLFARLFREPGQSVRFLWMYLLGFLPVMLLAVNKLAKAGLARQNSPVMADPFYDDHTVFGACLAMLLPMTVILLMHRKTMLPTFRFHRLIYFLMPITLISLALSFSRAAWLSIIAALVMAFLMRFKLRFSAILLALVIVAGVLYVKQDDIVDSMHANKSASGNDLLLTAASVTNVTTDESNRERVNRWSSALRMHEVHPWAGFGPGTYERKYGPYQLSTEKTRISTMDGDRGDAHSEYLGMLAEQGIPGLVIQFCLFLALLRVGMRVAYRNEDPIERRLGLGIVLGLITYFLHGAVNSFIDIDKIASLFWGMAAMLVTLDILQKKRENPEGFQ